jgi:hypothetical protein
MRAAMSMLTKQFAGDAVAELWLDLRDLPPRSGWKQRLSRLAGWVLAAERAGAHYGLRLPGAEIEPGRGEAHPRRLPLKRWRFTKASEAHERRVDILSPGQRPLAWRESPCCVAGLLLAAGPHVLRAPWWLIALTAFLYAWRGLAAWNRACCLRAGCWSRSCASAWRHLAAIPRHIRPHARHDAAAAVLGTEAARVARPARRARGGVPHLVPGDHQLSSTRNRSPRRSAWPPPSRRASRRW